MPNETTTVITRHAERLKPLLDLYIEKFKIGQVDPDVGEVPLSQQEQQLSAIELVLRDIYLLIDDYAIARSDIEARAEDLYEVQLRRAASGLLTPCPQKPNG